MAEREQIKTKPTDTVYAMGPGSIRFAGFYDNTDIAKKFARIMDIRAQLPVVKN